MALAWQAGDCFICGEAGDECPEDECPDLEHPRQEAADRLRLWAALLEHGVFTQAEYAEWAERERDFLDAPPEEEETR
jgi:hypothetical protein